jgi:hypothetical protein
MTSAEWLDHCDRSGGPDACWPWQGTVQTDGYAFQWFTDLRKPVVVHRHALAEALGRPITPGKFVCHTCDNRRCVNPAHLYEGDAATNGRDKAARGRARNAYTKFTLGRVAVDQPVEIPA